MACSLSWKELFCLGSSNSEESRSRAELIMLENFTENIILNENDCLKIFCQVDGCMENHTIFHNGTNLKESSRVNLIFNNKSHGLVIDRVNLLDMGIFTMICNNFVRAVVSTCTVHVGPALHQKPRAIYQTDTYISRSQQHIRVTKNLEDHRVTENQRVRLKINFTNQNFFTITWLKNNNIIQNDDEDGRIKIHIGCTDSELSILPTIVTDTGIYTCVIQTANGIVSSVSSVAVFPQRIRFGQPKIQDLPETLTVMLGEDVRLQGRCQFVPAHITWYHDGQVIENSKQIRYKDYGAGAVGLMIREVNINHAGSYSLRLKLKDLVFESTCKLEIIGNWKLPKSIMRPTHIKPTIACVGAFVILDSKYSCSNPEDHCAIWHVGTHIVKTSNESFQITQVDDTFLLYIPKVEVSMNGEVTCQIIDMKNKDGPRTVWRLDTYLTVLPEKMFSSELTDFQAWDPKEEKYIYQDIATDGITQFEEDKITKFIPIKFLQVSPVYNDVIEVHHIKFPNDVKLYKIFYGEDIDLEEVKRQLLSNNFFLMHSCLKRASLKVQYKLENEYREYYTDKITEVDEDTAACSRSAVRNITPSPTVVRWGLKAAEQSEIIFSQLQSVAKLA